MPGDNRNIYKTSRHAAGLTQEAAAERLGISVESVRAYETGQRLPPNDVVELMVILYNAQHLAYQHLRETNALYGRIVPPLEERSLIEAAVRIYNRVGRFTQQHSLERLMEIAEDNVIDDEERPEFMAIVAELRDIVQSVLEIPGGCIPVEVSGGA
ncbi:helix-turn-helix transcriptional regulator [Clostridium sp. J1101437_171009_A5]|uniref:helix-turn-helix domain-containing protein n=1 Tax=Clostridium sp. J1101437_171009_A5 TaxID=2787098 RepID=UPI00189C0E1D|nr:helix-turn-helix transcriptional regulator [Clostridium sp. J1101437_171009_A5]